MGNLKDPDKIEAKRQECKRKQVERMGLSPFYGRICSFSSYSKSSQYYKTIDESSDEAEIELINHILESLIVGEIETNKIITWNGFNFDLPFIYKRACLLKIPLPRGCPGLKYWTKKYTTEPHCDLMMELAGWNTEQKMNLDEAGKCFLGRGKTERDYSTYVDLIEAGDSKLIGIDNLCDTGITFDLYELLKNYLF
jgi:DNA polymerase elongation subunit (family B)